MKKIKNGIQISKDVDIITVIGIILKQKKSKLKKIELIADKYCLVCDLTQKTKDDIRNFLKNDYEEKIQQLTSLNNITIKKKKKGIDYTVKSSLAENQ